MTKHSLFLPSGNLLFPALFLKLRSTYFPQNYTSIIRQGLHRIMSGNFQHEVCELFHTNYSVLRKVERFSIRDNDKLFGFIVSRVPLFGVCYFFTIGLIVLLFRLNCSGSSSEDRNLYIKNKTTLINKLHHKYGLARTTNLTSK